jgi:hypothetical protein
VDLRYFLVYFRGDRGWAKRATGNKGSSSGLSLVAALSVIPAIGNGLLHGLTFACQWNKGGFFSILPVLEVGVFAEIGGNTSPIPLDARSQAFFHHPSKSYGGLGALRVEV